MRKLLFILPFLLCGCNDQIQVLDVTMDCIPALFLEQRMSSMTNYQFQMSMKEGDKPNGYSCRGSAFVKR